MNDRQRQEARIDQPIMQLQPIRSAHRDQKIKAPWRSDAPASRSGMRLRRHATGCREKGAATSALSNTAMILSSVSYRHSFSTLA